MDHTLELLLAAFDESTPAVIAETRYKNAQHYAETCDPSVFWSAMSAAEDARRRLWIVNDREFKKRIQQTSEEYRKRREEAERRDEPFRRAMEERERNIAAREKGGV